MRTIYIALVVAALGGACGQGRRAQTALSASVDRAETAGDSLLRVAPFGANLLLEVDLKRLRENPTVGPSVDALMPQDDLSIRKGLLSQASGLLVCVYGIGGDAKQLIIMRAAKGAQMRAAELGAGLFAVGEPSLVAQAVALAGGHGQSMGADISLLRLRAEVMPPRALSASVRGVVRLNFDARVSLAARVGMSEVPVWLSLWGDVENDLALVLRLSGETSSSQERLYRAVRALQQRMARKPFLMMLGLAGPLRDARVTRTLDLVEVVLVLSPKRLSLVIKAVIASLLLDSKEGHSPSAPDKAD